MDAKEELARAFECDSAGREEEAIPHYRRAIELGLEVEDLAPALLGLGSSLRNVGELEESVAVLSEAVARFPEHAALKVFLGYALWSAGRTAEAMRSVIDAVYVAPTADVVRYERAIRGYAAEL